MSHGDAIVRAVAAPLYRAAIASRAFVAGIIRHAGVRRPSALRQNRGMIGGRAVWT
jgi:hypothetical protein